MNKKEKELKPLEALEIIKECAWFGRSIPVECYVTIETALNEYEKMKFVIKTIKEKGVHLSGTGEAYTQEEYDAIKEILL